PGQSGAGQVSRAERWWRAPRRPEPRPASHLALVGAHPNLVCPRTLVVGAMNIGTLLPRYARFRPDHLAVVFEDHRLTSRQFNARVNRLANGLLAAGLGMGDKLATVLPNCLELLETYCAAAKTGIVVVPMSPRSEERRVGKEGRAGWGTAA